MSEIPFKGMGRQAPEAVSGNQSHSAVVSKSECPMRNFYEREQRKQTRIKRTETRQNKLSGPGVFTCKYLLSQQQKEKEFLMKYTGREVVVFVMKFILWAVIMKMYLYHSKSIMIFSSSLCPPFTKDCCWLLIFSNIMKNTTNLGILK